jgi:DnaK suppressor protein
MTSTPSHPSDRSVSKADADALRAEAERTRLHVESLEAEYEALLADSDTIQEDRDATRQYLEEARGIARTAAAAVERLDAGEYGRCTECGNEIPPERLEAIPDVETCVACSR